MHTNGYTLTEPEWTPFDTPHPTDIPALPARFVTKIAVDETSGCWEWTACRDRLGYGRFSPPGGRRSPTMPAYRYAFAVCIGRIPRRLRGALDLDHLCRNTSCVNPWHLEPVRHRVNVARGAQSNDLDGLCRRGLHPWSGSNILVDRDGTRRCRPCRNAWDRERRRRVAA